MKQILKGFSKLSREDKIKILASDYNLSEQDASVLNEYLHPTQQLLFDDISENVISNYFLPFSIAPNFLINGEMYQIPMVTEESSVVAAASKAASFWARNGGFKTRVINTVKLGQIFINWTGSLSQLIPLKEAMLALVIEKTDVITKNMHLRGGGIVDLEIKTVDNMPNVLQILIKFNTANSMGANFINSCLETAAPHLIEFINQNVQVNSSHKAELIMSILSNYTPDSIVECKVNCPIEKLEYYSGIYTANEFAKRFKMAVEIAKNDPYRAATHNKGIMNGIDAVVIATGNDFRATESNAHTHAINTDNNHSLTSIQLTDTQFEYTLKIPLAIGTVGGLTRLHPMAKIAMNILKQPSAEQLMQIIASAGLANNFSAIAALVTSGIQKGHMKLHINNILSSLDVSEQQKEITIKHFNDKVVSVSAVKSFINSINT